MKCTDTYAMREYLDRLMTEIEEGKLSNSSARVRVQIAKAMIDTVKVEIAAAALGRAFGAVSLARPERQLKVA
jgi:hypothetical protein